MLRYIIIFSPCPVNTLSGTLFAWAAVHSSNFAVLSVPRRNFPLFADFEGDSIAAAGHNKEPVVVVVDNSVEQDTGNGTAVATVEVAGSCSK